MHHVAEGVLARVEEAAQKMEEHGCKRYRMRLQLSRNIQKDVPAPHGLVADIPVEWVARPADWFELRHHPLIVDVLDAYGYPVVPRQLRRIPD